MSDESHERQDGPSGADSNIHPHPDADTALVPAPGFARYKCIQARGDYIKDIMYTLPRGQNSKFFARVK